ncbi:class III extradiol dioxygenase subunit B-like domain-containing protein [Spirillospora sp. NBC_01491]|uniref:class III extradiol dioxygenase subunit B-like domain-containing protein n=1 Tax=Spirillospora sp. NBC_01491 TaxID=2976007 RepID=UPI002E3391DC|nr:class III extradiol dioxygenase subunit B-like domain-containing protein [Spirillospora sp. NBC_01491]
MLISAAVCPHPPVLVPEAAGEAAPELDAMRAACDEAVRRLGASRPDAVVVVGGGPETRAYGGEATATLRPYGLDLVWGSGPDLPLSLTIGHWLLTRDGTLLGQGTSEVQPEGVRYQSVAFDATPDECLRLGRELAGCAPHVALLVMGDGTACLSEKAPGSLDERAAGYEDAVAQALGRADTAALAGLDPEVSRQLQVAGRAAWQVLAGAAVGANRFEAGLLAREEPYGVGYLVASWRRPERGQEAG